MEYTGFSALHNAGAKSLFACAALAIGGAAFAAGEAQIALRPGERGPDVPKTLYGIFFEDINYSADGGIYPELVANRGFDWDNGSTHGWENDFRGGAQARISIEHVKEERSPKRTSMNSVPRFASNLRVPEPDTLAETLFV